MILVLLIILSPFMLIFSLDYVFPKGFKAFLGYFVWEAKTIASEVKELRRNR